MLIKNVVIPTLHFSAEIFGMCEARVLGLKRVLDFCLNCIVKWPNFCRLRAYEEFDILPLYVLTTISRANGLRKWLNFNSLSPENGPV